MLLRKINLNNFRNYPVQEIDFNGSFNYIHGNNGEGKTNILEAVSFISFGKSFLNSAESDCVKFDTGGFDVSGTYENDIENIFEVRLNYDLESRKKVFHLNSEKVSRWSSEIFGKFPAVFMSPHSLNITYGNPSERRKFFDILLAQTSRVYLDLLKNFTRVLKQKNALLKGRLNGNAMSGKDFRYLLNSFNEKLVEFSAEILFRRFALMERFIGYFRNSFEFLTSTNDEPAIAYFTEVFDAAAYGGGSDLKPEAISEFLAAKITEKTAEEMARGISVVGPHRDDFIFRLKKPGNGKTFEFDIKNFASQGEHKTFVIALKLAEYHFLKDSLGNRPILLLDDLLS
ncbi:MAG: DNA replication and repair protein RecF, partial [Bacteroidetes bacterium]|nr:DNA replication and repair protein RecF [Bacteroidota bacterium]